MDTKKNARPVPPALLKDPAAFMALGFGSGLAPKAPGTFGTLAGIPGYWLMADWPLWAYGLAVAVLFGMGVYWCETTARRLGVHDHPAIVWDEVVGYLVTMAAVPASWQAMLAGFFLFRLFDIVKPWPIRWLDRHVHGGFGIMLDDALAGVFAWGGLALIRGNGWL